MSKQYTIRKLLKIPRFVGKIINMLSIILRFLNVDKNRIITFVNDHSLDDDESFLWNLKVTFKLEPALPKSQVKKVARNFQVVGKYFDNAEVILDYGGANGDMAAELGKILNINPSNNYVVDLLEWSDKKVEANQDITWLEIGKNNDVKKIKSCSVDVVTAWYVLHHVKNLDGTMKFIKRILKPGGKLIIKEHDIRNKEEEDFINLQHMIFAMGFRNAQMKDYNKIHFKGRKKEELDKIIGMSNLFSVSAKSYDYSYFAVYEKSMNKCKK